MIFPGVSTGDIFSSFINNIKVKTLIQKIQSLADQGTSASLVLLEGPAHIS